MNRPQLNKEIKLEDFQDFYWLKDELIEFCKYIGIYAIGSKKELTERIILYLKSGVVCTKPIKAKNNYSNFDWQKETLSLHTIITDNYKNTENVRAFFKKHISQNFTFDVSFMNWMKENIGKNLANAIEAWHILQAEKKYKNYKSEIAPQFQYNQYMRDFLADNPKLKAKDAMHFWKLKSQQRGQAIYNSEDLNL